MNVFDFFGACTGLSEGLWLSVSVSGGLNESVLLLFDFSLTIKRSYFNIAGIPFSLYSRSCGCNDFLFSKTLDGKSSLMYEPEPSKDDFWRKISNFFPNVVKVSRIGLGFAFFFLFFLQTLYLFFRFEYPSLK